MTILFVVLFCVVALRRCREKLALHVIGLFCRIGKVLLAATIPPSNTLHIFLLQSKSRQLESSCSKIPSGTLQHHRSTAVSKFWRRKGMLGYLGEVLQILQPLSIPTGSQPFSKPEIDSTAPTRRFKAREKEVECISVCRVPSRGSCFPRVHWIGSCGAAPGFRWHGSNFTSDKWETRNTIFDDNHKRRPNTRTQSRRARPRRRSRPNARESENHGFLADARDLRLLSPPARGIQAVAVL